LSNVNHTAGGCVGLLTSSSVACTVRRNVLVDDFVWICWRWHSSPVTLLSSPVFVDSLTRVNQCVPVLDPYDEVDEVGGGGVWVSFHRRRRRRRRADECLSTPAASQNRPATAFRGDKPFTKKLIRTLHGGNTRRILRPYNYPVYFTCLIGWDVTNLSRLFVWHRVGRGSNFLNPIQSIKSVTQSNPIHNDDLNADPNPIQSIWPIRGIYKNNSNGILFVKSNHQCVTAPILHILNNTKMSLQKLTKRNN